MWRTTSAGDFNQSLNMWQWGNSKVAEQRRGEVSYMELWGEDLVFLIGEVGFIWEKL